jgi:PTH1 family peptidyl-tRNA hydrolase
MVMDGMSQGKFGGEAVYRGAAFGKKTGLYLSLEGELSGIPFLLVKPTTFMNESGRAVTSLITRGVVKDISELLVVVDDVDLDVGRVRMREKGSAGTHNGLKSIVGSLGSGDFQRIKIGVGPRPDGSEMVDYVLGRFRPDEYEPLSGSLEIAAQCVEAWIAGGMERARIELSRSGQRSANI